MSVFIEPPFERLREAKLFKLTIPANDVKKIAEKNPYRHLLVLWNISMIDLNYGDKEDNTIIPFPSGSVHRWESHLFIVNDRIFYTRRLGRRDVHTQS
jgi:hypothetical protein